MLGYLKKTRSVFFNKFGVKFKLFNFNNLLMPCLMVLKFIIDKGRGNQSKRYTTEQWKHSVVSKASSSEGYSVSYNICCVYYIKINI